jgi:hypothetical protein
MSMRAQWLHTWLEDSPASINHGRNLAHFRRNRNRLAALGPLAPPDIA